MKNIDVKIAQAKPSLYTLDPLRAAICWGYAVVNIAIGIGLYYLFSTSLPIAVANILPYRAWGVVFAFLGLATMYALITNNWNLTRRLQLGGLFIKSIWEIALILRFIDAPQTIIVALVWLFFAYIQAVLYIFFFPRAYAVARP